MLVRITHKKGGRKIYRRASLLDYLNYYETRFYTGVSLVCLIVIITKILIDVL